MAFKVAHGAALVAVAENIFTVNAPLTRAEMDLATNSVLAMAFELLPALAVGTEVVPVTVRDVVDTEDERSDFLT